MKENVLADKTLDFSVRIVGCYKYLRENHSEYVMSKQVLRSGTSIGANVFEAVQAQSKADFISKMSIALKEASETSYWMKLLERTEYLSANLADSLRSDLDEIIKIIISSIKTTKKNIENNEK